MKGTLEANFDNVKSIIPFEVDDNMSDEEIADCCVALIKEEIAGGFPHATAFADFLSMIGEKTFSINQPSPIFIPKRKKFKRRYKR